MVRLWLWYYNDSNYSLSLFILVAESIISSSGEQILKLQELRSCPPVLVGFIE